MKNTIAILGVTALLVSAAAPQLQAGNVSLSIGAHFPLPLPLPIPVPVPVFSGHVVREAPVYVRSAPVAWAPVAPVPRYYVPAPVVVYAPPAYYAPAPCYAAPAFGFNYRWGSSHHDGHGGHYHH